MSITSPTHFDLITIFPEFFQGPLEYGIIRQAIKKNLVSIKIHNLRKFTLDTHQTVDDRPFGGEEGMVLKPEPIFRAVKNILGSGRPKKTKVILLSPQGKKLSQNLVWQLYHSHHLIFICGRYEGVDERVANNLATDEISIGDYILSGGELATCVLIDCLVRITPGVLNNYKSAINESFSCSRAALKGSTKNLNYSLLDHPQYTRPEIFDGMKVPSVLLSGNHKKIKRWRRKKALEKTLKNRPDLLEYDGLSEDDKLILAEPYQH